MNDPQQPDRRTFLAWLVVAAGGVIAVALGIPGALSVGWPAFRKRVGAWVPAAAVKDLSAGTPQKVEFAWRQMDGWLRTEVHSTAWVIRKKSGEVVAFNPACTHLGCPYRWDADQKRFLCPCHAAVFDEEGQVLSGPPPRPLDRYATKVEGGTLYLHLGGEA